MSTESFKKFMAKVQQDEGLRKELRAAGGAAGMSAEAVAAFAAGKGYEFKVEDISNELTDKQLDSVAGGVTWGDPHVSLSTQFLKIDGLTTYLSAGSLMFKF